MKKKNGGLNVYPLSDSLFSLHSFFFFNRFASTSYFFFLLLLLLLFVCVCVCVRVCYVIASFWCRCSLWLLEHKGKGRKERRAQTLCVVCMCKIVADIDTHSQIRHN